jgi:hypothetical protein
MTLDSSTLDSYIQFQRHLYSPENTLLIPVKTTKPFIIGTSRLQNSVIKAQSRNVTRIGYEIEEKFIGFIPIKTRDSVDVTI